MNLLSLKAVGYSTKSGAQGFYSPQRSNFMWPKGIVVRECPKCETDIIDPDCTCGLYSSPNPNALVEYSKYPNMVFVLLNNYGWVDIWTGPKDLSYTHVIRSWGARIIGVVGTMDDSSSLHLEPERYQSALLGMEYYDVKLYGWKVAKEMIRTTWKKFVSIDPFIHEEYYAVVSDAPQPNRRFN